MERMRKYQLLFKRQVQEQLQKMLAPDARTPESEVYRMIHSIKGTAGTIGLPGWYAEAIRLLMGFEEEGERLFTSRQLAGMLEPLMELSRMTEQELAAASLPEAMEEDSVLQRNVAASGTVLVLDDDIGLLTLLKDELETQGLMVLATPYPDKALRWFYDMQPDCLVLDLVLPDSHGFRFLNQIHELCELHLIPVIIISARSDKATRMRAYEAGADEFMAKPLELDEFSLRVRKLVARKRRLNRLLMLDENTGAYTMNILNQQLPRFAGQRTGANLIAVHLQGLRGYNEQMGYEAGDRQLRRFSDYIRMQLRVEDIWVHERSGHFYLLQPEFTREQSFAFMDNLLHISDMKSMLEESKLEIRYAILPVQGDPNDPGLVSEALTRITRMLTMTEEYSAGESSMTESLIAAQPSSSQLPIRLVIVDDDPLIRSILERQLRDIGGDQPLELRTYPDGLAFMDDPWNEEPGRYLLILDRMMPRMNGMEVLARIRSMAHSSSVYTVLMLTSIDNEHGIAEAIRVGADDYMTKPFSIVELEARVRRLLNKVYMNK
ncbi:MULTISPECIES: response regulator [Paenibacillus]|uniref:response regulator n=1 Tax=Paenibacillus TaxID=44249 RepID=UPI00036375DE|nr:MULTISPECIES: response regulator [Paenibacillus]